MEDYCTQSTLAYLNGETLVVMNVGEEPLPLPAGEVILRSSAADATHPLGSGETIWLSAS
ncbi:hypothetical protein D3C87_2105340 [compost metagenome]